MIVQFPFEVDGSLLRVLEAGFGDRSIVFLHGLGARADRWRQTLEHFAEAGYHCFAFDLPGHGLAQKGSEFPYGVPGFARLLDGFLREMKISPVHLVGTSLGGHICAYLTCLSPGQVHSLTLVGTTGMVPIGAKVGGQIRDNIRVASRDGIRTKLLFVLADPALVTDSLVEEEWRINNSPGAEQAFARLGDYIAGEIDHDCVGLLLKELIGRPPLLLVWGELDRAVPISVGHTVREMLPEAPFVVIRGAGHAPYYEKPPAFNQALLSFLNTQTS